MRSVKIDLRNRQRERLFRVEVDPRDPPSVVRPPGSEPSQSGSSRDVYLEWDGAFDDHKHLRRCPACGCRELFARKDFPQITGFAIVVAAAVAAMALFGANEVIWGVIVLAMVALIDAAIYLFSGRCLVCYRCRTEFRDTPIRADHPNWELATGEKYRHVNDATPQAETK